MIRAEAVGIIPNFFLSQPYLELSKAQCYEQDGWIWLEADGWPLFTALPIRTLSGQYPLQRVWSDFETRYYIPKTFEREFLDYEYVFDSTKFNDMKGGQWETFRKNSRKWGKGKIWYYNGEFDNQDQICTLISDWIQSKQKTIQDAEILANYAYFSNAPGIHRKFLYTDERLKAINAWDENYYYINYRVCMVSEEKYLDEFARWAFYTDPDIQDKNKLINDGGVLGNSGLERFKNKMNPLKRREVYSWKLLKII